MPPLGIRSCIFGCDGARVRLCAAGICPCCFRVMGDPEFVRTISQTLARWHSRAYQTAERRAGGILGLAWCNGPKTKSLGHSQMPPAASRSAMLASGQALHRSVERWHNLRNRQLRSDFGGHYRRLDACSGPTAGHNVGVALASRMG